MNPSVTHFDLLDRREFFRHAEEFAAWYAIATALLNLDETISKG